MWLGAVGTRQTGLTWRPWQHGQAGQAGQQVVIGGELSGGVSSELWAPGEPHYSSTGDHCLYLRVWEEAWNTAPGQPYATVPCVLNGYTLCEGEEAHHTHTILYYTHLALN